MAWFELESEITIGSFRFKGVHDVRIKRSLLHYDDSALIKLPSIAVISEGKRASASVVTTGSLFTDGDEVIIKLGYRTPDNKADDIVVREEFRGFVKRRNLNMPLEVECEGYIRKLRLDIDVVKHYKSTSAKELLELVKVDRNGKSTGINVVVADDLPLINVSLPHCNGVEICDAIKRFSQGMLNIFFIDSTTLWCGLTYTPYTRNNDPFNLGVVNYRLGWNLVKENSLKERVPVERVQILFGGTLATGEKIMSASDDKVAMRKDKSILNNIGSVAVMRMLANEKQFKVNYAGYEGSINGFLQPFCLPGYQANIVDARYMERNGVYMVEGTEVTFGMNGARRKVEIGPKIGFAAQ